ncbi:hypothetical protein GCM10023177_56220 [Streptomyces violaceoruber]|nr:hypothetical protein JCM4020_00300 [Streptomyces coelicolor]
MRVTACTVGTYRLPCPFHLATTPIPSLAILGRQEHPGGMSRAPVVVHRPSISGSSRVSAHRYGRDEILGTVCSDHDLVVFLEGVGIDEAVPDDRRWVEWRGGPAHEFRAA